MQVLDGGCGPGLAIFLRHGMREWIEVCCWCVPAAAIEPVPATVNREYMRPETRTEMVSLLAGLFLQKRWEVRR